MKKLHYNLRMLLILVVAGALLLNVALVALFGNALMGRYYAGRVKRQLVTGYEQMVAAGEFGMDLAAKIENKGISITLVDKDSGALIYTSQPRGRDQNFLAVQVVETSRRLLSGGQNYVVGSDSDEMRQDPLKQGGFCVLNGVWGGYYLELRIPLESVSVMAGISQEFQILVCAGVLVVLILLLLALAPGIVRPMQEMSETADQIARLDFSARCRRSRCREMDDLGLSLNEMADRLQDYTGKLQTANAQLKQDIAEKERAEAARKRLIAGLSHDLKTPIALISGYAEGLSSGMARTPEQVAEYCGVIGEESDRMSALISRMLELSRLESGAVRPEPERFDLSELLDGLAGLFRVEIGKADIALEKDFPPECMVCTDAGAAEQVLTNYVQNAVAHMGEGRRLRIAIRDAGPRWRAEVFNSAPPFSEEERQSIWETFYRGEGSRRRKNGESGLGLAIVRGNMELLNLPYGVRNEADGVVFFAEFPKG